MPKYRIEMTFRVVDLEAAKLQANVFGADTVLDTTNGTITTNVEADTPDDAIAEALEWARRNMP